MILSKVFILSERCPFATERVRWLSAVNESSAHSASDDKDDDDDKNNHLLQKRRPRRATKTSFRLLFLRHWSQANSNNSRSRSRDYNSSLHQAPPAATMTDLRSQGGHDDDLPLPPKPQRDRAESLSRQDLPNPPPLEKSTTDEKQAVQRADGLALQGPLPQPGHARPSLDPTLAKQVNDVLASEVRKRMKTKPSRP